MAIVTRLTENNDERDGPEEQDRIEQCRENDGQQEEYDDDQPTTSRGGRIKPGEVRNRWGRKGKPKEPKSFEQMKMEALARLVDVPQRDGTVKQVPLIYCIFEQTLYAALKGTVYQRLALLKKLDKDGDLARVDAFLRGDWDEARKRAWEESMRRVAEIEKMFMPENPEAEGQKTGERHVRSPSLSI